MMLCPLPHPLQLDPSTTTTSIAETEEEIPIAETEDGTPEKAAAMATAGPVAGLAAVGHTITVEVVVDRILHGSNTMRG
ncbi:hypothetical protein A2U01_0054411, partial [Trifolium medium]|nr:hypothetical protein [Trifolium medium]